MNQPYALMYVHPLQEYAKEALNGRDDAIKSIPQEYVKRIINLLKTECGWQLALEKWQGLLPDVGMELQQAVVRGATPIIGSK